MKRIETINPLQSAAEMIIREMKTPAALLDFLNEAIYWMHKHQIDGNKLNKDSTHVFFIHVLIDQIILPWMKGEPVEGITNGLEEVNSFFGADAYVEEYGQLILAYSKDLASGAPPVETMEDYSQGFNVLLKIGIALLKYESREAEKVAA